MSFLSDHIDGNAPDNWVTAVTLQKPLSVTMGLKNNGPNSIDVRLRGRATAVGNFAVLMGPATIPNGNAVIQQWETPLWELEIQVKRTVAGQAASGFIEYAANVD